MHRVTNAEIAAALDELGVLYELDGAVKYRVLAYSSAAKAIRESPVSIAELAREGRATEVPGVGKTLAEKIDALLATGEIPAAVKLKAKFPPTLIEVTRVPGLGAKTARRLFDELGIVSLEDLKAAAEAERIREVKGLGPKVEENVLASLERLGEPGEEPARLAEHLAGHPLIAAAGKDGSKGVRAQTHNGISVDLRIVAPEAFGNLLQHFTGSQAHNVALRENAVARGLSVSEHGITDSESGK